MSSFAQEALDLAVKRLGEHTRRLSMQVKAAEARAARAEARIAELEVSLAEAQEEVEWAMSSQADFRARVAQAMENLLNDK